MKKTLLFISICLLFSCEKEEQYSLKALLNGYHLNSKDNVCIKKIRSKDVITIHIYQIISTNTTLGQYVAYSSNRFSLMQFTINNRRDTVYNTNFTTFYGDVNIQNGVINGNLKSAKGDYINFSNF